MERAVRWAVLGMLLFAGTAVAQEAPKPAEPTALAFAQLQQQVLLERIARLRAEFDLATRDLAAITESMKVAEKHTVVPDDASSVTKGGK